MSNPESSTFARWKSHFINWREWELNPIVVKELRQAVRSWAVTGMLFLFLVVLLGTAIVMLLTQSFENEISSVMGSPIFGAFSGILTLASVVFIPLYIGVRVAAERQDNNIDLLYVTTLTPGRIIRGKFFCGAYVALLFVSCCMPFMTFTTLLRGVDLPTIFFSLLVLFMIVCLIVQATIFFACLPISKALKILLALIVFVGMFVSGISLTFSSVFFMRAGVGTSMSDPNFWIAFFSMAIVMIGIGLLLYFLSVALISPPSANRALPVRVYLSFVWLLGAVIAFYWTQKSGEMQVILAWTIPSLVTLFIALVVVVSNEDELSLRVLRAVPKNPLKRALAFLFYNGAAGGVVWNALLMALTFLFSLAILKTGAVPRLMGSRSRLTRTMSQEDFDDFFTSVLSLLLYGFAYALAGLWIHRRFLSRRPAKLAGLFAVLLPAGYAIVLYFGLFFINRLSWKTVESLQPGNMFNVYALKDPQQKTVHLFFAVAMFLIFCALNLKWFSRQARRFQRYERSEIVPPVIASMLASSVAASSAVESAK